jgi:pimeloyl-ACP methyl ester carboxylesterase
MNSITFLSLEELANEVVESHAFRLPCEREISFIDSGGSGPVLFYNHGGASCRFEALTGFATAREHGFRIIAADRPGYGRSTDVEQWTLRRWAGDIAALADALSISEFAVAGTSAGGPYSLAVAAELGVRVRKATLINTAGSPHDPAWSAVPLRTRLLCHALARTPGLAPYLFGRLRSDPHKALGALRRAPEADKRLLSDFGEAFVIAFCREGLRQGIQATIRDLRLLYASNWGLPWSEPRTTVRIVQGEEDLMLPFVKSVARTHQIDLRVIPGGHLGGTTPDVWKSLI